MTDWLTTSVVNIAPPNSTPLPSVIHKVNRWLDHIGEYDVDARAEVLDKLHTS
jgi:hypothetical protein